MYIQTVKVVMHSNIMSERNRPGLCKYAPMCSSRQLYVCVEMTYVHLHCPGMWKRQLTSIDQSIKQKHARCHSVLGLFT